MKNYDIKDVFGIGLKSHTGLTGAITRTAPFWVQDENSYHQATACVVNDVA